MSRRFQFSLRALMVAMVVAALLAAGTAEKMRHARQARIAEARVQLRNCQEVLALHRAIVSNGYVSESAIEEAKVQVNAAEERLRTLEGR